MFGDEDNFKQVFEILYDKYLFKIYSNELE